MSAVYAEIDSVKRGIELDFERQGQTIGVETRRHLVRGRDLRHKAALMQNELAAYGPWNRRCTGVDERSARTVQEVATVRAEIDRIVSAACPSQGSAREVIECATRELFSPDASTCRQAIARIGELRLPESVRILEAMLVVEDDILRADCLELLVDMKVPCAGKAFAEFLHSDNPRLRLACLRGLHTLGERSATTACLRSLADQDAEVRRAATTMLGWQNSYESASAVAVLLKDEDGGVRLSAAKALGELCSEHAVFALIGALTDAERQVRVAAKAALERTLAFSISLEVQGDPETLSRDVDELFRWWSGFRVEGRLAGQPTAWDPSQASRAVPLFARSASSAVGLGHRADRDKQKE